MKAPLYMRPLTFLLVVSAVSFGYSSRLQADDGTPGTANGTMPGTGIGSSPGYLGLSLNAGNIGLDQTGVTTAHTTDVTYSIFGGNPLWKYLSVEYGLATLGNYSADYQINTGAFNISEHHVVKFDRSAFASLLGWFPLRRLDPVLQNLWRHNDWTLSDLWFYGKVGASYWHAKVQMSGQLYESGVFLNSYGSQGEGSGVSPLVGLGLHYRIGADTAVRLDWTQYALVGKGIKLQLSDGTEATFGGKNVSVLGLALMYSY